MVIHAEGSLSMIGKVSLLVPCLAMTVVAQEIWHPADWSGKGSWGLGQAPLPWGSPGGTGATRAPQAARGQLRSSPCAHFVK